jgi:hypothetical protein
MNANGTEQRNVTRTGSGVNDTTPDYGNVSTN